MGFTDVIFCPMLVNDLGVVLLQMLGFGLRGVYHVVGSEPMSKYEFGLAIARTFGFDPGLIAAESSMRQAWQPRGPITWPYLSTSYPQHCPEGSPGFPQVLLVSIGSSRQDIHSKCEVINRFPQRMSRDRSAGMLRRAPDPNRGAMEIRIGDRLVGNNHPTYFIADIAANHDGDLDRARKLIRLARESGADAAKFQNFQVPRIVSDYGFKHMDAQVSHQAAWKDRSLRSTRVRRSHLTGLRSFDRNATRWGSST